MYTRTLYFFFSFPPPKWLSICFTFSPCSWTSQNTCFENGENSHVSFVVSGFHCVFLLFQICYLWPPIVPFTEYNMFQWELCCLYSSLLMDISSCCSKAANCFIVLLNVVAALLTLGLDGLWIFSCLSNKSYWNILKARWEETLISRSCFKKCISVGPI